MGAVLWSVVLHAALHNTQPLQPLHFNSPMHIELVGLDSICKEIDCCALAWFKFIYLVEPPDAMGVYGTLDGGESGYT